MDGTHILDIVNHIEYDGTLRVGSSQTAAHLLHEHDTTAGSPEHQHGTHSRHMYALVQHIHRHHNLATFALVALESLHSVTLLAVGQFVVKNKHVVHLQSCLLKPCAHHVAHRCQCRHVRTEHQHPSAVLVDMLAKHRRHTLALLPFSIGNGQTLQPCVLLGSGQVFRLTYAVARLAHRLREVKQSRHVGRYRQNVTAPSIADVDFTRHVSVE